MGYNANITQIEGKITSINGLAAAAIILLKIDPYC